MEATLTNRRIEMYGNENKAVMDRPTQAPMRPIPESLDLSAKCVTELRNDLLSLLQRLEPVLGPPPPRTAEVNGNGIQQNDPRVSWMVGNLTGDIRTCRAIVGEISDRLEI